MYFKKFLKMTFQVLWRETLACKIHEKILDIVYHYLYFIYIYILIYWTVNNHSASPGNEMSSLITLTGLEAIALKKYGMIKMFQVWWVLYHVTVNFPSDTDAQLPKRLVNTTSSRNEME